jgi:PKD repeat protein
MRLGRVVLLAVVLAVVVGGATAGAPTPAHVHFTALGDYGSSATTGGVLDALSAGGSDAHLALGDLSYGATGAEEAWCSFVKARVGEKFPFQLLAGNHEGNGQNGNINDFSACLPNQLPGAVGTYGRQYYVDVPQADPLVRYVMISPDIGFPEGTASYAAGSARYNWTATAIDGARQSNIPWVVVGMHKPCLSMGTYACDVGADLANLLVSKRVDLVLTGHEHDYQRSKQLALGTGCTTLTIGSYNPSCVADADNALDKGAGTVFATIGTGGQGLYDVNAADPEAGYFAASSGGNQNPTYGYGDFDATPDTLTAKFVRASGGTFTDGFTITRDPAPNQPPVAAFTSTTAALTATFDGSGSTDQDGSVASWAWGFGDGTTGTGAKPQHPYAAAGTYPVKLTVTDNRGATNTVTQDVTVTAPPTTLLASDEFDRTLASGWGRADLGGSWTLSGDSSRFSVSGSAGRLRVPANWTHSANLNTVSSKSSRVTAEFSVDKIVEGTYVALVGRQVGAEYYAARLTLQANGQGRLLLVRGTGESLGVYTPTFSFLPGERYRLSTEVKGTSPTTVSAKVWKAADPEPAGWQRTATTSFAALQAAGAIGVFSYLPSASAASAPVTVAFHQLSAVNAG